MRRLLPRVFAQFRLTGIKSERLQAEMSANTPKDMKDAQREAFSRFGASCLWSKRPVDAPTAMHLRIIARSLKSEGGKHAYEMARKLEEICDAADRAAKTRP